MSNVKSWWTYSEVSQEHVDPIDQLKTYLQSNTLPLADVSSVLSFATELQQKIVQIITKDMSVDNNLNVSNKIVQYNFPLC